MQRIFNLILIVCGLVLAIHVLLTVGTERASGTRWSLTEEGRAGIRTLLNRRVDPFLHGGDPANSALILNFRDQGDPLTIDAVDSWIYFDFDGRGQAVKTGWVGPGIGLLVTDPDGSGLVTSGRQLFGNRTLDGNPRILTGFEALAQLDDNGDGLIDRRDAGWTKLRVWLDKKPDGRVTSNELFHLEQLKIKALELNPKAEDRALRNGNYLKSRAWFIYDNGRRGPLDEVFFQQRAGLREYRDGLAVSPEVVVMAPDLKGHGLMRDFRVALMQSPELQGLYRRYNQSSTRQAQLALMDDLLMAWAEAGEAAPTLTARLGDSYDLTANCLTAMNPDHLRRLEVMEAWWGRPLYRLPHELYPGQELMPGVVPDANDGRKLKITCPNDLWQSVLSSYDQLSTYTYEQLLPATRLKRFYDRLNPAQKGDWAPLLALFEEEFSLEPEKALTDLLEFRLGLALDQKLGPKEARGLDEYIEEKVDQTGLSPDQNYLYDRLSGLNGSGEVPAEK